MAEANRREILSRVAAGTLSPEEAAAQLEDQGLKPQPAPATIRRVRVVKELGPAEIIGDPAVRDAVAEGPHRARIDGDVMTIEGEAADEPGDFVFGLSRVFGADRLLVRMNPTLALDLEVQAGSCRVHGIQGPIRGEVQAGTVNIDGFEASLALSVQAGSVRATGTLREGESHITCEAGSVNLHLRRGSSVQVSARTSLGKVTLPVVQWSGAEGVHNVTIGDGRARLLIETSMGTVRVTADP